MWNTDFFAQDSWKVKPNFTLELGVRAGYWTNNAELNGLGAYFDPGACTTRTRASSWIPGTFQRAERLLLRRRAAARRTACCENRGPFAMPRVNVAWDIDGQGNNVLRGGYGLFFNRNMGNVEYDHGPAAAADRVPDQRRRLQHAGSRTAPAAA